MDLSDAMLQGLSRASAIMAGQSIGANLKDRAKEIAFKTSMLIFLATLIGATIVYFFRDQFIWIFTQDPAIWIEAKKFLEVFVLTLPFFGIFINAMFIGRGSGHTLPPTIIGIARLWGCWVGIGYFLALLVGYGPMGIWIGMSISNIFAGITALAWLKYGNWTQPVIRAKQAGKSS